MQQDVEVKQGYAMYGSALGSTHERAETNRSTTVDKERIQNGRVHHDPDRLSDLTVPTGLITGSESPPLLQTSTSTLNNGLPTSRLITLPGQTHEAVTGAPALFAKTVTSLLQA